jgi:hypothetical protein
LNELLAGTVEVGGNTTVFPAGCTSATGYSTTTGLPCTTVSTLPAGCTSTTGFSSTTGQSCSATTVGGGVTQTGAEGSITVSVNPTPANNVKVYEGDTKVAVLGLKIKATGSDVDVQRATLRFSVQPYSYFTNLYLYDGSTQVASAALNSDTVSKVAAGDYEITLSGFTSKVIVAKDATKVLTVQLDVLPGISSGLLTAGVASINIGTPSETSIRAVDQAGLNQYGGTVYSSTYRTFTANASQSANATLTVSLNTATPKSRNVVADSSDSITGVNLMSFDLKATKDNVLIDTISNVVFTTDNSGTYQVPDTAYLVDDSGNVVGTATPVACTTPASVCQSGAGVANFTDLNYTIAKDTTKTFSIKIDDKLGDVNATTRVAAEDGRKYVVTVNGTGITGEKSNGSSITGSNTAASNAAFVYGEGPVFTLGEINPSNTQGSFSGASSTISDIFNIQVAAVTGDVYMSATGTQSFVIKSVTGSNTDTVTNVTYPAPTNAVLVSVTTPTGGILGNTYKITAGTTASFKVSATQSTGSTVGGHGAGTYALNIDTIRWGHTAASVTATGTSVLSNYMATDSSWAGPAVYLQ